MLDMRKPSQAMRPVALLRTILPREVIPALLLNSSETRMKLDWQHTRE